MEVHPGFAHFADGGVEENGGGDEDEKLGHRHLGLVDVYEGGSEADHGDEFHDGLGEHLRPKPFEEAAKDGLAFAAEAGGFMAGCAEGFHFAGAGDVFLEDGDESGEAFLAAARVSLHAFAENGDGNDAGGNDDEQGDGEAAEFPENDADVGDDFEGGSDEVPKRFGDGALNDGGVVGDFGDEVAGFVARVIGKRQPLEFVEAGVAEILDDAVADGRDGNGSEVVPESTDEADDRKDSGEKENRPEVCGGGVEDLFEELFQGNEKGHGGSAEHSRKHEAEDKTAFVAPGERQEAFVGFECVPHDPAA